MINKCCDNCALKEFEYIGFEPCDCCEYEGYNNFAPKEQLVRQDEKNKILDLLKEDLKDYKKLREEYKDNKNLAIEDTALIVYINSLIADIKQMD